MEQKLVITPKTKILDLITDYPELEEILFDISPAFKKLKNPVLRRTVARVTTLQQAALVGAIKVEDLVNRLRKATGTQEPVEISPASTDPSTLNRMPEWFSADKVMGHLDAREMLNRGEHPVTQVLTDLHSLPADGIYELIAPFYPAPLIDKATGIGFMHYITEINPEEFRVYFMRS
jgi:hypothetical protein